MNIDAVIDSIYQLQGKDKLELIVELRVSIQKDSDLIINSLKRVFIMIEVLLENEHVEVIQDTLKLVQVILKKISIPQELEQPFQIILKNMINQLGSSVQENRKLAKDIIQLFVKRTRNIEMVFNDLIKNGFTHQQFHVRETSIKIIPKLIMVEQSIFQSYSGVNDMRRVIENLIVRHNDSVQVVREQVAKTLYKIREQNQQNFEILTRRLADEHVIKLKRILESQKTRPEQKFYEIYIDQLKEGQQKDLRKFQSQQEYVEFLKQAIPEDIEEILEYFPQKYNMYFGFISRENLINSFNFDDVQTRQQAVQFICETFLSLNHFDLLHQSLAKFFKFILKLLQDQNNTIKICALEILTKLVNTSGVHVASYINLCLPTLAQLLSYENIQIRLSTFKILRNLIKMLRKNHLLINFVSFLKEKQQSWQYYFELLKLICYIFLDEYTKKEQWYINLFKNQQGNEDQNNAIIQPDKQQQKQNDFEDDEEEDDENYSNDSGQKDRNQHQQQQQQQDNSQDGEQNSELEQLSQNQSQIGQQEEQDEDKNRDQNDRIYQQINFTNIMKTISIYLDHDVNKVKHMSFNLLAVITNSVHQQEVQQILHEIIDKQVYDNIMDKVQIKEVYFLNSLDMLEMPVIEIEKFSKHKDDYEEHRKLLEDLRLQKEQEEKELREKKRQQILEDLRKKQREQFTKQHVVTQAKNEILQTNKQFDQYFEFNNKQNDNYKYDIVVPVNDIKMTTANVNDFYTKQAIMQPNQSFQNLTSQNFQLESIDDLNKENSNIYSKKKEEFQTDSKIHKNKYKYQPKPQQYEYSESEESQVQEQPKYVLQYQKDDVKLNINNEQQRINDMENINRRIQNSVKESNNKKNNIMNIPLVVQANANQYKAYYYDQNKEIQNKQDDQELDIEVEDMFLNFKEIKKVDQKIQKQKELEEQKYQEYLQEIKEEEERKKQQEEQERINYFMMPTKERFLKKMIMFLEHDEDESEVQRQKMQKQPGTYKPNINPGGKRNRQQRQQNIRNLEDYNIPSRQQLVQLESPLSEMRAAVVNIKSNQWQIVFNTLQNIRAVNRFNFEILFKPEINLKVLTQDIVNQCEKQNTGLVICTLVCLKEMVEALKEALNINVGQILTVCLRKSLDTDENIVSYSRQVLQAVGVHNFYSNIINVLISTWDNNNLQLKISIGLILEPIMSKITRIVQKSDTKGFQDMLHIISLLIQDEMFEARRLGKKIFFKMINNDLDHELLVKQIQNKCQNSLQLLEYIEKFKELFKDDQELYQYQEEVHKDPLDFYVDPIKYSIFDNKAFNSGNSNVMGNQGDQLDQFIQRENHLKFM